MKLYLHHGRKRPDENLDDWGPDGPELDVTGIHETYQSGVHVFFATPAAFAKAQAETGWKTWENDRTLVMPVTDDLVAINPPGGEPMFFGDWGIIADKPEAAAIDLLTALHACQTALAMMISPDAIKQTSALHAFAQATEAETKARSAIAKAEGTPS